MEETNRMTITDESGDEKEVEILLTFDDEKHGKSYVLFQDPESEEGIVYAYSYTEDGEMDEVTDEDEWKMCEEVLGAFMKEEEEDEQ